MHQASTRPAIAITTGEPAGIGPEISIRAAWAMRAQVNCVLLGDAAFLALTASLIDPDIKLAALSVQALRNGGLPQFGPSRIAVIDVPLGAHVVPGVLDPANGRAVLATLDLAVEGARAGWFDAIVTAPLQKSTINDAGVAFSGHTEYLADKTGTDQVVMMLAGETEPGNLPLRVALATTHLPLKDVSAAITRDGLGRVVGIIDADLKTKFGIASPRILVTGLNPHAGENGYLGREEIDTITPALEQARARGIDARGPYPADTLFQPKYLREADCVLAMYHDQGLPVLKYATFGRGVNITLGLPLIRTSVDHGTALDLAAAGLGRADCGSMEQAIRTALHMVDAAAAHGASHL
ncbi:4-hydroxythreonine-4-phosphate dehydrogenase PdxA [Massilia pseudoviolaceinigra]|uniref:4-hydroxythreonine-4-phosphate dehydrogenase PdxA n=1 Tax=Massilia pseudoviolaceinigra TaxID=3057165 RepID=UPI002796BB64|nr:4-hydroxythreonine-4-phosphate dehydrogenase PdxA [Massilia sp. CCM 9206]MDQ1923911.1 4-hydroxythreonine-4-phosphate dehydrogenase PdxA [Massilia sp. CCM 9206]